ncbi:MAG: universal stress protein [Mycolicibacterium sp.]|nr:universal stress protein [Mycolicibacterium sp.]
MRELLTPPSVVVGIDGSRAAVDAALWAVDEAVSRDIPLRLVYALDERDPVDPEATARNFATAEIAVRGAVMAVQATDQPIKVEMEIVSTAPARALAELSRSASMVCVGAIGLHHVRPGGFGSTAEILATTARCPVAIIGRHQSRAADPGFIVVDVDESPADGVVLDHGMREARLRGAPLRVVSCCRCGPDGHGDHQSAADGSHQVSAQLNRRLQKWSRQYRDVDVECAAPHNGILDYLAENRHGTKLVVMNARNHHDIKQLLRGTGSASLPHIDCSILVVNHQRG